MTVTGSTPGALLVGESQLVRCGRMLQGPIDGSFIATGRSTAVRRLARLKLSARQARMITLLVSQQGRLRFEVLNEALQGHSSPLSGDFQRIPSRSATAEHVNYLLL